ncbi:MAG: hypothetical protein ACD_42C00431G0002 [uncultured bacterium]|nr:MAG: hypothetical protein ACD_42C00431G0002 [uncultured bacterium]OGT25777.1 MAG: hypothetical protein A3B71_01415 [Gammaproteobacteria bacterium RIFCSPHIGHO2_02_FULL_42_43]OGT28981.1 MAG: hypothetical protein A2624_05895 [Gammaproteobacteria bacterium RIFCSPHIGHO2_01_FULL_42_8]OGT51725.1 MAG: hypothetical protein A3E54_03630 [Gammaproteobacteria bacterium RIFCSPHIGHO2_12_FULL_41_25]OGT61622.1 MAG: hypothetical protein A3I77_03435 [Gammaproteobacteria bacterium RIFCSPLOWO2_02_FULL_42_14]OGT
MKNKRKSRGFFIVEVLIVLVIAAVLTLIFLPNLQQYVNRAKFADVGRQAAALKPAVELCIHSNSPMSTTGCSGNAKGIPADNAALNKGSVKGYAVAAGIITVTGDGAKLGTATDPNLTLTPAVDATTGTVTWTKSGTCEGAGLC